ncbi:MAG TPA: succinate dehydrogenase cytochrome b subunit [Thermoanaerobaculia bacterium]|nr:succinate dehydrogenase cytochrome b subunit [Thermoanaerobaculia bacterium]
MTWFGNFYRSSIGKKAVMAVTGLILFGWIFLHMLGNLKLYMPAHENAKGLMQPAMDIYAVGLRELGAPFAPEAALLWVTRILLLVCVVLHIHAAYALTRMASAARPVAYRDRQYVKATYASRTMRWGGVIILLFIIYHLLHLTTGQAHPRFEHGHVHNNVVTGLQVWWVSAIYIIANLALGLHLYHGVWAMFGSLGLTNARVESFRRIFATVFAVVITAGNISFPLAVLTGMVKVWE